MSENLPTSLFFLLNRQPVFYIRQNEVLSDSIQISPSKNNEFSVPLYAGFSIDNESIIKRIQAVGIDKLANSLQDTLDVLSECHYDGIVTKTIKDEVARCRAFAEELRKSVSQSSLCNSCNDWMRGGCSSTCSAYGEVLNHE